MVAKPAFRAACAVAMRAAAALAAAHALAAGAAPPANAAAQRPVARIVSLAPHATELLFDAGAGPRVAAVSESCDYPEVVRKLPNVSGYRGTNVEAVVALKPDVVVVWPGGNRVADIDALVRLGVPVYRSELATLADITRELRQFSQWAVDEAARKHALHRADEADRGITVLRTRYAGSRRVRVFYQLGAGRLFTLSDQHVVGEALAICGAENIFGKLSLLAPEVSQEAVLAARPDAVLVADPKAVSEVSASWRKARLLGAAGPATYRERIAGVDGARLHRPTLRTVAAVQAMCAEIDRIRQALR